LIENNENRSGLTGLREALLVVLLWLVSLPSHSAPMIEIRKDRFHTDLTSYIDIFEDKGRQLGFDEIRSPRYKNQFSPSPMGGLYFGFTDSVYWVRFSIHNKLEDNQDLILEITPADIDLIEVYLLDKNQQPVFKKTSGSAIDFDQRDYDHPLYYFDIESIAGETQTVFIRFLSDKTINVNLKLSSKREHFFYSGMRDWNQGFLLGAMLLITLAGIILGFSLQVKSFFYISAFVFSIVLMQCSWNGYLLQFMEPDTDLLDRQLMLSVYLSCFFGLLFARSFLNTHAQARFSHRLLTFLVVIALIGVPSSWLLSPIVNGYLMSVIGLLTVFVTYGVALYSLIEGNDFARYFLFARTITIIVILFSVFSAYGLVPQTFINNWGIAVAVLFESMIFMYVLLMRDISLRIKKSGSAQSGRTSQGIETVPVSAFCHELRTPISGVMGMSELLLDTSLSDQQRNQLETIRDSGKSLLDVVNKMTSLSSLELGEAELEESLFELVSIIEACIENTRSFAERRNIELIYSVGEEVQGIVKGDQEKLQQVIDHLVNYLVRRLDGGEVLIAVSPSHDGIQFEVVGGRHTYSQDFSPEATSPQSESLTSRDNLNLTIARQIIALMGGELNIAYRPDGGVRMMFVLNLRPQAHVVEQADAPDEGLLRGKRLLVVDDNDTCCKIVQQQGSHWGMEVETALSGAEALAVLRNRANLGESFDLMLIDYDMPSMNGIELIDRIYAEREQLHADKSLVAILTGVSKMPSQYIKTKTMINRVLYKPLSGKSLKAALIEMAGEAET
jgi:signal transduction histidine kinase/CheY-like chemotaxis protein